MLHDGRAQQVEADDVIAQLSAKTGGDRFGDLDSRKLDGALSERVPGQWRNGDAAGLSAVEERLDLPVPFHPLGKTHPAGAFAWRNTGPTRGKMPEGWTSTQGVRSDNAARSILPIALRDNRSPT